jgi:hypothetical protein
MFFPPVSITPAANQHCCGPTHFWLPEKKSGKCRRKGILNYPKSLGSLGKRRIFFPMLPKLGILEKR